MQVGRKTVPNMWPGDSEAPVEECVVCAWNDTQSAVEDLQRPNVCRRKGGQTKTRRQNMLVCS